MSTYVPYPWADGAAGGTPITAASLRESARRAYDAAVADAAGTVAATTIVAHAANAATARPTGVTSPITWVGSVPPANALDGDLWVDTSS